MSVVDESKLPSPSALAEHFVDDFQSNNTKHLQTISSSTPYHTVHRLMVSDKCNKRSMAVSTPQACDALTLGDVVSFLDSNIFMS